MTPVEIAYFKHFMFDKDLARSFQHLYKARHINGSPRGDKFGNPLSIEKYFMQTSVKDVIMKAFYFSPTNNNAQRLDHTYDYWKDIDDKWQEYMKQNDSNFSNDSWPQLRKSFAILRQNWDIPFYWRHENLESTEEVYERMNIQLPLPDFLWEHGGGKKKDDVTEEKPVSISYESLVDIMEEDDEDDDLEIDFVHIDPTRRTYNGLAKGVISVNIRSHSWKVAINRTDTKEIRKKDLKYAMVGRLKSGDVVIQFNRNPNGTKMLYTGDDYYNVNSRQLVHNLRQMLSITDDLVYMRIEKIAEKMDSLTYKITKQE